MSDPSEEARKLADLSPGHHLARLVIARQIESALRSAREEGRRAGLREAADLHESMDVACDHERLTGDPGAGAMAAVIQYRDAIRALADAPRGEG
ncbi:hypothetical protein [Longimicrobium sp.]|uniref:hypothetical protein n=1 Tax=Longimicrobium sp. TaxID=2029185 RepID=UPI002E36244E|nr:hypothetical protein [Longimicrobium sp.]